MAKDPVCNAEVDEKKAHLWTDFRGKRYFFDFVGCKKLFDENPERYLDCSTCCACMGH